MTLSELSDTMLAVAHNRGTSRLTVRELAMVTTIAAAARAGRTAAWGTAELAHTLKVGKPVVTRACACLSMQRLVECMPHPADKRMRAISLTRVGELVVQSMLGELAAEELSELAHAA